MALSKWFYSFCAILCLLFGTCCQRQAKTEVSSKPLILVSISPYLLLTERIAGPDFRVATIVPAAANPHSFEPTSHQILSMSQGQVWLCIGEPFEKKILPILRTHNPDLIVTDLREGIDLLAEPVNCKHCSSDHADRHIWLSPTRMQSQAQLIADTLSAKYPAHQEQFQKNVKSLCADLQALDAEIRQILQNTRSHTLLVSHPAFAYFCKDFNLTQISIEYEGKDPRPKHLEEVLQIAISQSAEVALALPQHNNKGVQLIAEKLRKPIRLIDPYSSNYFEMMRTLAHIIQDPYANSN